MENSSPLDTSPTNQTFRISKVELRRRLWHIAPGVLPFILWAIPHSDPMSKRLSMIVIAVIVGLGISIFRGYRKIARNQTDKNQLSAVAGYAGCVLLTLLILPAQLEIGFMVLAILAFGDGFATLGGLLLRGPALPWNREKTYSGLFCFILIGGVLASLIYWGESHNLRALNPHASFATSFTIGMTVAFFAALVETIPSRINDNIRVGLAAACLGAFMHWQVTGWV